MKRFLWLIVVSVCLPMACKGPAEQTYSMSVGARHSPWIAGQSDSLVLSTAHYRIFSTTANRAMVDCLPGFMEAAHRNYLRVTGLNDPTLAEPMDIYMMGTRGEWADLTQARMGERAKLYMAIEAGGYCYEKVCVFWDMGGMGTLSTASHEGLHQFFAHRMKDPLPMWLEEGMCTTVEGYQIFGDTVQFTPQSNPARFGDLRTAIMQGKWIPLAKLLPMDAGDAVTRTTEEAVGYYGQLWALSLFLRSNPQYRAGLNQLLRDARDGKFHQAIDVPAEAYQQLAQQGRIYNQTVSLPLFKRYISKDLPAFEREYEQFARRLVDIR